jgi:hypothetical protein
MEWRPSTRWLPRSTIFSKVESWIASERIADAAFVRANGFQR